MAADEKDGAVPAFAIAQHTKRDPKKKTMR